MAALAFTPDSASLLAGGGRQERRAVAASAGWSEDAFGPHGPDLQRGLQPGRQAGGHGRGGQVRADLGCGKGGAGAVARGARESRVLASRSIPRATCLPRVATTSSIRYWNVADGKELRKSQGHGASVYAVAFSPDGTKLASGSVDKTIRIWNVADGKELHKLDGHPDDIYAIAFSPDGKRLASVGYGGNIYVWDVAGAKPLFHQHVAPYTMTYGVAWSPDGSQLAVAASDNNVYLLKLP